MTLQPDARGRRLERSLAIMKRIGQGLLQERKAAFLNSGTSAEMGKDVLSLMVKANMEAKQGMSDDDILAREFPQDSKHISVLTGLLQKFQRSWVSALL